MLTEAGTIPPKLRMAHLESEHQQAVHIHVVLKSQQHHSIDFGST